MTICLRIVKDLRQSIGLRGVGNIQYAVAPVDGGSLIGSFLYCNYSMSLFRLVFN